MGEVGLMLMATAIVGELEGSGAEDGPWGAVLGRGAAAGWGAALDATSEEADTAGAGGRHRAENR